MRHRKNTVTFGRQRSHYKATMRHLVAGLIINKRITTTKTKAKEASRLAEKLVTTAKKKTVTSQRKAYRVLQSRDLVAMLFNEIAPLFSARNGGYTRVMLINRRRGDNAQMAILEFVEKPAQEQPRPKSDKKSEKKKPEKKIEKEVKREIKEEARIEEKKESVKKEEPIIEEIRPVKQPKKPEAPKQRPGFFKKIFGKKGQ